MKNERITVDLRDCIAAWEHDRDFAEDALGAFCADLRICADRIDERAIGLPVDACGTPIRLGDELEDVYDSTTARVACMLLNGSGWSISSHEPNGVWYDPDALRHVQHDSWERILEDAVKAGRAGERLDEAMPALAARCEALAKASR